VETPAGREVHSRLLLEIEKVLSHSLFEAPESQTAFFPVSLGQSVNRESDRQPSEGKIGWPDYFKIDAKVGDIVSIEVRSIAGIRQEFDPSVMVYDLNDHIYQTCRNPGDDHVPPPGLSDKTPEAFDDICWNDDADPLTDTNSKLEVMVPGKAGESVSLYLRVSDWNGAARSPRKYTLTASNTSHVAQR